MAPKQVVRITILVILLMFIFDPFIIIVSFVMALACEVELLAAGSSSGIFAKPREARGGMGLAQNGPGRLAGNLFVYPIICHKRSLPWI
jgi:hypothetical protein